jgi:hypothetical protein
LWITRPADNPLSERFRAQMLEPTEGIEPTTGGLQMRPVTFADVRRWRLSRSTDRQDPVL